MQRDQVLLQLAVARKAFDDKVKAVPAGMLDTPVADYGFSVKQLIAHIDAYDRAVVDRIVSAQHGSSASLEADRDPELFDQRSWVEKDSWPAERVLSQAANDFESVTRQIRELDQSELDGDTGAGGALPKTWLAGRAPWLAMMADTARHYTEHYDMLDAAIRSLGAAA